jgi:multidrug efflux pump subunit AcrA (membrane-fusion protein)
VWVVDENQIASLRYVTLGASRGDSVEVLSGIGAGETVVLSPADRELGGVRVQP